MKSIIDTLQKADNEATRCPYWLILDPKQNMRCNIHEMAGGVTGPFFCREDAENFLERTRYNFSKRAKVYCLSGHNSYKYEQLFAR
jgi:hypothetical protein